MCHTYIPTLYYIYTSGWAILGVGGADMVIGEAGGTAALAGGGIPGMVIRIGGGTEIIGGHWGPFPHPY